MAVDIVVPEREIPGIKERICEVPIKSAFVFVIFLFLEFRGRLAIIRIILVIPRPIARIVRFEKIDSNDFLNINPISAAGIVATIKSQAMRPFSVFHFPLKKSCKISVISLPK